jgi:hypothetical protein
MKGTTAKTAPTAFGGGVKFMALLACTLESRLGGV